MIYNIENCVDPDIFIVVVSYVKGAIHILKSWRAWLLLL